MEGVVALLIPIACGCVLPIMLVWLSMRQKMNETDQRTKIILTYIEKNPQLDIEDLMNKLQPKQRRLKSKLLGYLLRGMLTLMIGVGLLGFGIYLNCNNYGVSNNQLSAICCGGGILMAVGIAFLVNYHVGKKMLAKEIEAEEKQAIEDVKRNSKTQE